MTDINLKKKNFEFFFKNLKYLNFDIQKEIKDFKYFIPKYYFNNSDRNITIYYNNKFLIDKINKNNDFIQEILKFNRLELENIEINMSTYIFDKQCLIFNGKLSNSSSDLKKFISNSSIYQKKNSKNNKANNIECTFYSTETANNVYDLYKVHKSFFENYTQPLYILLINNEYNKNSKSKKYFLKLLSSQVSLVNDLFSNNILGSLSKKSIFEIIEKQIKNKNNNKSNNNNNNKNTEYRIYGNNSKLNSNYNEKNKKFYYEINDINSLYQTYNINVDISNMEKLMKSNFNSFYDELKKIVNKKINNLYDLLICSLNMEKYFINFLVYYFKNEELQQLYQLDNDIKLSIYKNIDIFKSYYNTYRSELDKLSFGKNNFDPLDFKLYFNGELKDLFNV